MEILRTLFAWFNLPWRELTFENMFTYAKKLKRVDKEAIRYSKYVPLGQAGAYDEENKEVFMTKLQERIARIHDRMTMSGGETQALIETEFKERRMTFKKDNSQTTT